MGGTVERPDLELEFGSIPHLNAFFAGKSKKFTKIIGLHRVGLLLGIFTALMAMAGCWARKSHRPVKETRNCW